MTALQSMIRVHRWMLDEKRRKLAELQKLRDKLEDDIAQIQKQIASEQESAQASDQATLALPGFVASALDRCKRLRQTIRGLDESIETARSEVQQVFQELKAYEQAQESHKKRERKKREKREQALSDEQNLDQFRRRAAVGK